MKWALPMIVTLAFIAASAFAINRYVALDEARCAATESKEQILEAQRLMNAHPEAFGDRSGNPAKSDLKRLVLDSGARNGIALRYLTETERDAGEKVHERDVLSRMINVPHDKLVLFLADLEANGSGARIKEIRLKPASDKSNVYQEAETVLAIRTLVETKETRKSEAPQ
jgi:hypothetical protein